MSAWAVQKLDQMDGPVYTVTRLAVRQETIADGLPVATTPLSAVALLVLRDAGRCPTPADAAAFAEGVLGPLNARRSQVITIPIARIERWFDAVERAAAAAMTGEEAV